MSDPTSPAATLVADGQVLTIRVCRGTRSAIVAVEGESDSASAHRLGLELRALCSQYTLVVVDCVGLRFLGSSGLTVVLDAHLHARARGNVLRLVINKPAVLATLRVSGLDRELDVFVTMNDALML
ncbi:MAG: STAS domain-containing protein [Umezawaea sp.]